MPPDASAQIRLQLFPTIEPYATHRLKVSDLHEIHVEECGNPDGKPVLMVHGGPGAGCGPNMRRYHDPDAYRIILFDQRGCGRSTPHAELRENTTWDLVADMEAIRAHLGIDTWQLLGGSWGSCLALAYAETHPERVTELVLRAVREVTGRTPAASTTGGTSDGRFIAPTGAQVVEVGVVNATIHKVDEHVDVADIDVLVRIYERVMELALTGAAG